MDPQRGLALRQGIPADHDAERKNAPWQVSITLAIQGDPSGLLKPPVDLIPIVQAGWRNFPDLRQREDGHPVDAQKYEFHLQEHSERS